MLDFAVKVTEQSSNCSEDDVAALRVAGWSDEEIMDITEVAAMFNFEPACQRARLGAKRRVRRPRPVVAR
jgi:alkylhydroperoxidase family enzyme